MKRAALLAAALTTVCASALFGDENLSKGSQAREKDKIAVSVLPTGPKYAQVITVVRVKKDKSEILLQELLEKVLSDKQMEFSDGAKGRVVEVPGLGDLGISMWEHIPSGFKFPDGYECTAFGDCLVTLPKKLHEEQPQWAWRLVTLHSCEPAWKTAHPDGSEAEWRASWEKFGGHNFDALSITLSRKRYNSVGAGGSNFCVFYYVLKSQVKACSGLSKISSSTGPDGDDDAEEPAEPAQAKSKEKLPGDDDAPKSHAKDSGKRKTSSGRSALDDGGMDLRK